MAKGLMFRLFFIILWCHPGSRRLLSLVEVIGNSILMARLPGQTFIIDGVKAMSPVTSHDLPNNLAEAYKLLIVRHLD